MTDEPTNHYEWLIAASEAADNDFGEDISHLTPEQMVAMLSGDHPPPA